MENLKDIKYETMPNVIDALLPLTTKPSVDCRYSICVIYLCDMRYSRYDMRWSKFILKTFGGNIESFVEGIMKLNKSMFHEVIFVDSWSLGQMRGLRVDDVFILQESELNSSR